MHVLFETKMLKQMGNNNTIVKIPLRNHDPNKMKL